MTQRSLIIFIFLPMISGIILGVLPVRKNRIIQTWVIGTIGIELLLIYQMIREQVNVQFLGIQLIDQIKFHFRVDGLSIFFMTLATFLWLLASIYSFSYMRGEPRAKQFYCYMLIVLTSVLGIAVSGNLMMFYIFYEMLTIATFPLVIFRGSDEALRLGGKYLFYSFIGSTFLIVGMSVYFHNVGNLNFSPYSNIPDNSYQMVISYLMIFLGFSVKTALVPFHSWLPSAMIAPTPVSALLHAVAVVKSGVFGMIRLNYYLFGAGFIVLHHYLQLILLIMIGISTMVGAFLAYHHANLKKRLAYSTISQLGYIMLGIVMSNGLALTGAMLHFVNHAVIKMSLFFAVGSLYKNADVTEAGEVDGLGKLMPFTFGAFIISTISIMGLPPTNGFVSKWYLSLGAIHQNRLIFIFVMLLSAFMTAIYLLPIGINAFFKPLKSTVAVKHIDLYMKIPIAVLVSMCLVLGLFPNRLIAFINVHIISYLGL